jgi:hypothetical protein
MSAIMTFLGVNTSLAPQEDMTMEVITTGSPVTENQTQIEVVNPYVKINEAPQKSSTSILDVLDLYKSPTNEIKKAEYIRLIDLSTPISPLVLVN